MKEVINPSKSEYGEIGKHYRLIYNLSALLETAGVEFVKFGERFKMPIPSQA